MLEASSGPVVVAETAAEIAEIAAALAANCNPNLRVDAAAVAWLAASVTEVSADLTAANVGESEPLRAARTAATRARAAAERTRG
jgi:formiminotetrahydrofolate cyclodeaminase